MDLKIVNRKIVNFNNIIYYFNIKKYIIYLLKII